MILEDAFYPADNDRFPFSYDHGCFFFSARFAIASFLLPLTYLLLQHISLHVISRSASIPLGRFLCLSGCFLSFFLRMKPGSSGISFSVSAFWFRFRLFTFFPMEMSSLGACIPKYVRFVSVALLFLLLRRCTCGLLLGRFLPLSSDAFFMLISGVLGVFAMGLR